MKIRFISMTITGFHQEEDLFVTVQFAEEGEATPYRKFRATSFRVPKQTTIEDIGRMLMQRIKGNDRSQEKKELYEKIKEHFGGNYEAIEKAIKEASEATLGWEAKSVFSVPDFQFPKFRDYMENVIFRRK